MRKISELPMVHSMGFTAHHISLVCWKSGIALINTSKFLARTRHQLFNTVVRESCTTWPACICSFQFLIYKTVLESPDRQAQVQRCADYVLGLHSTQKNHHALYKTPRLASAL